MSEIIVARDLSKIYRRGNEEIHALKNVSFAAKEREFISIIGPSGSGKTAFLNVLGCLDTPSSGSLRLNGTETKGLKESDLVKVRRDNIGFVFQQFYLMPTLTARENVELPLLFSHYGLYVPAKAVSTMRENKNLFYNMVRSLARVFQVSNTAARIRVNDLILA